MEAAWEENNEYFQIERSSDGKAFKVVGSLPGQGDADVQQRYQYYDPSPMTGINYYRLKQIDYDGQFSYSNIISVTYQGEKKNWSCYPTVTNGPVKLVNTDNEATSAVVQVFDMLGRRVLSASALSGLVQNNLDLSALYPGTYLLVIKERDVIEQHFRIIKR